MSTTATIAPTPPPPSPAARRPNRRPAVIGLSLLTAVVEVAALAGAMPGIDIGRIRLSASVVPAAVLAVVCGGRLFGAARTRWAAIAFWSIAGAATFVTALAYLRTEHAADVVGLALAAFDEELVYRLAVPAVVAVLLRTVRVPSASARITGLVAGGAWFVLLPGHRGQMTSPAAMLPFVAFAALSALLVYRSGSVLAVVAAHTTSNLLTILVWSQSVDQGARSAVLGSVLVLLVFAYGATRRYVTTDDGAVIDLRSGRVVELDLRAAAPELVGEPPELAATLGSFSSRLSG